MPGPRSHEENLKLVCVVCTNLNGYKAKRSVVDKDIELIKKHVFPGFCKNNRDSNSIGRDTVTSTCLGIYTLI